MRQQIYNIIEPNYNPTDNKLSRAYDWVMLIAIMMSIIPLMFRGHNRLFYVFDIVSCTLFIIDYLLRWITADYRRKKKGTWVSFALYPFTPMAIIDLLSILPTFKFVANAFKLTRVVRLLKIIRVVKIIRYFEPLRLIIRVIKAQRVILATVLVLELFYVFVTALIMFNAEPHISPVTGKPTFASFFDALYWATVTLTTVGYGDLTPVTNIGRLVSMLSSLFGVAIIALPSGVITASYLDELRSRRHHKNNPSPEKDEPSGDEKKEEEHP